MRKKPEWSSPQDPNIPRRSFSQIEQYLRCGWLYFLTRVEKLRMVNTNLAIGSSAHEVHSFQNTALKNSTPTMSPTDAKDYAVAAYQAEFAEAEAMNTRAEIADGKDMAALAGAAVVTRVTPTVVAPIAVELPVLATYNTEAGPFQLTGVLDLVDKPVAPRVRELKTAKRAWSADRANSSGQLSGYSMLHKSAFRTYPKALQVDCLSQSKKEPGGWKLTTIPTSRTEQDLESLWAKVDAAEAGIRAGVFLPAPEGSWFCSKSACPAFDRCKFVGPARRQAAEEE